MRATNISAPLTDQQIERLAQAAHEIFLDAMRARGFTYGAITDEARHTHNALRPFAELTDDEREQNRLLARAIPEKLQAAGYMIVAANTHTQSSPFPGELLERLAEDEHARWVRAKLSDAWRFEPVTDKPNKRHASLIRWRLDGPPSPGGTYTAEELALMGPGELTEPEREKDRVMIRGIPAILDRAGLMAQRIT